MHSPIARTSAENTRRAQIFVGTNIRTTDNRVGEVVEATPTAGGVIKLGVETPTGEFFETDNEHATITD